MSIEQHDSGPTSNDLLEILIAEHAPAALSDRAASPDRPASPDRFVAEGAQLARNDVENIEDAPAVDCSGGIQALE